MFLYLLVYFLIGKNSVINGDRKGRTWKTGLYKGIDSNRLNWELMITDDSLKEHHYEDDIRNALDLRGKGSWRRNQLTQHT